MKPINIYALTRITDIKNLSRLERQYSAREDFLHIKDWEIKSLRSLSDRLLSVNSSSSSFSFYYSFQIPKLGKEFDLLRIGRDRIINIELKSSPVSDEDIKKQLLLNKRYLSVLGRQIRSYTYISSTDRLIRLTNSGRLLETDFTYLYEDLISQTELYESEIEALFKEEAYLIAPLAEPERFLRGEYFLTAQMRDIKEKILAHMKDHTSLYFGFTGLPGTGKTLLLYNLALSLTERDRVLLIPMRTEPAALSMLDDRLKRIDFLFPEENLPDLSAYTAVLIDEAHLLTEAYLNNLLKAVENHNLPLILAYDYEEAISEYEHDTQAVRIIEKLPSYERYHLTNRIRMNAELSSFTNNLMRRFGNHRESYPGISLVYADSKDEAELLLKGFSEKNYRLLTAPFSHSFSESAPENVIMVMDEQFYYDEQGYLRSHNTGPAYPVRDLFEGLGKAKSRIALLIYKNPEVLYSILSMIQGGYN